VEIFDVQDLSLHILDIVENSIRAEASRIEIHIVEDEERDLLSITIQDNGRGMEQDTLEKVLDPFTTTRNTRRVGLGLPLLAESARRTGGDITVHSEVGKGTTVRADFQYSNIDRIPIGNMIDTLMTLFVGNPEVDFSYTHTRGDKQFALDSADVKSQLEDVPLSHPEVVKTIREYLQEGFEEIGTSFF
jgi:anti-sigma regulatory factor (Ser/Thr protein kinase)